MVIFFEASFSGNGTAGLCVLTSSLSLRLSSAFFSGGFFIRWSLTCSLHKAAESSCLSAVPCFLGLDYSTANAPSRTVQPLSVYILAVPID